MVTFMFVMLVTRESRYYELTYFCSKSNLNGTALNIDKVCGKGSSHAQLLLLLLLCIIIPITIIIIIINNNNNMRVLLTHAHRV